MNKGFVVSDFDAACPFFCQFFKLEHPHCYVKVQEEKQLKQKKGRVLVYWKYVAAVMSFLARMPQDL